MPFQSVSSMFEKDKRLWLFGEKGLYYFDEKNKQSRTFTVEDGLPGNEFNVSAIAFSSNGNCIAGSTVDWFLLILKNFQKIFIRHVHNLTTFILMILYITRHN